MGVAVQLGHTELTVVPGTEATNEIRIRNTGAVVDQVELGVLGDAAGWTRVEPPMLNLLPGQEAIARIVFAPPRVWTVPAGETPYALRASSRQDTTGSVIEEATVTVEAFDHLVAELVPRTSRGARAGHHEIALDNLGNRPAQLRISSSDPDELMDFRVETSELTAAPGTATFVHLRARPRTRFLRGADKAMPFGVAVATEDGAEPALIAGTVRQRPILRPWLWKVALVIVALQLLWALLLKPQATSAARSAAKVESAAQAAPLVPQVGAAQAQAASAAADAKVAKAATDKAAATDAAAAKPGAEGDPKTTKGGATPAPAGGPPTEASTLDPDAAIDFRGPQLPNGTPATVPTGQDGTFTQALPPDAVVWISDMVLQNPHGDRGTLRILRDDEILFEFGLGNFFDLDYHLVQPVQFTADAPLRIYVQCTSPGPGRKACSPAVYFAGQRTDAPAS